MQVVIGAETITGVTAARLELDMGPGTPGSVRNLTPTTAVVVEPDAGGTTGTEPPAPGTGTTAPADGGSTTPPADGTTVPPADTAPPASGS